jgi:hypothetical protein
MDSGKIKTGASLCLPLVQRAIRAPGNAPDHTLSTIPRFGKLPCQRLMQSAMPIALYCCRRSRSHKMS